MDGHKRTHVMGRAVCDRRMRDQGRLSNRAKLWGSGKRECVHLPTYYSGRRVPRFKNKSGATAVHLNVTSDGD